MAQDLAPWFVMIDGEEAGPLSVAGLTQRFAAGEIEAGSYVWKDGMTEWLPASQVDELAVVFAPKPAPAKRPPPPPAAAKAKAKPKINATLPDPDSHVFRGRDDDEEEVLLEIDFAVSEPKKNASAPGAMKSSSAGVQKSAPPAPAKPAAAAAPAGPNFGGAAKPPSQPYGVPIGEPGNPRNRGMPSIPTPDEEEDVEDWADRTSVEQLPFGERIHQENVASSLFSVTDPGTMLAVGKTGSFALDNLQWAQGEMKSKPPSVETKPAAEASVSASAPRPITNPRPASNSGISRQPTTALRQPLPEEKPRKGVMVIAIAGGAMLACSIAFLIYFALK